MPYLLRSQSNDPQEVDFYSQLRSYYFNSLADIMIDHFTRAYSHKDKENHQAMDPWTLSRHLLYTLDPAFTSMDKLATLGALAQTSLVEAYDHAFEALLLKQTFIQASTTKFKLSKFDENRDIIE